MERLDRLEISMTNIAVIEDDRGLNNGIVLALKEKQYTFRQYFSFGEIDSLEDVDLIILDINLPDGNGFDFLRELRRTSQVPVIILTANDLETDEVAGLELGADDYMTKPFSLMVLRARIEKILDRSRGSGGFVYQEGEFYFDFVRMKFLVEGTQAELSKTEQKLLYLLVSHPDQTISRELLIDRIWTDGAEYVEENALSVTINRLRNKLERGEGSRKHIHTVYGIGYVWKGKGT